MQLGTIKDALEESRSSRSQLYRDLSAGNIKALKRGRKTLIDMDSLRAHLASLPAATFRTPAKAA
jgi:hypothetical protein